MLRMFWGILLDMELSLTYATLHSHRAHYIYLCEFEKVTSLGLTANAWVKLTSNPQIWIDIKPSNFQFAFLTIEGTYLATPAPVPHPTEPVHGILPCTQPNLRFWCAIVNTAIIDSSDLRNSPGGHRRFSPRLPPVWFVEERGPCQGCCLWECLWTWTSRASPPD